MKIKIQLLIVVFTFLSFAGLSQSKKYKAWMKKNITIVDTAKTEQSFLTAAIGFEKMASSEKKDWLPCYYAGLCYVYIAYQKEGEEIDKWSDKAETFINRADSLSKNNAEIYVLKSMCSTSRIMVDPMARGFMFGKEAYDYSQTAMTLDPANPRPYANKGVGLFYTPESFGGGVNKARPFLEKAVDKYKTFKPASELHPNWGQKRTADLLKQCNEN